MLNTDQLKKIYGNEQVLLVLFSRLYFSPKQKTEVEEFIAKEQIDWNLLLKITIAHSIRSFIFYVVNKYELRVETSFEEQLKKRYQGNLLKNFRQLKSAITLISDFKNKGIVLIPYKGAIFSQSYYDDIAIRESSDIDFLIPKEKLSEIEDHFIAEGYRPLTAVPRAYLRYYRKFFKDIVYQKQVRGAASIEMHWRLMERFSGNYPAYPFFAPHLQPYQIGGLGIEKLSPTYDFLAVASNHFVKDMGIKFKYLIDMACLIKKEQSTLDSEVIFSCAKRFGFEKKMNVGLELVKQFLGVELINKQEEVLSAEILKTPLQYPIHLPRLYINEPKFIRRSLQLQDNFLRRIQFISRCSLYVFLPTYADIIKFKLPVYYLPLFIVMRPFRLCYQMIRPAQDNSKKIDNC